MSYCFDVSGWQKKGRDPRAGGSAHAGGRGGCQGGRLKARVLCVNSEPAPRRETSPSWFYPAEGERGQSCLCPCPPPRGGVPKALTCMWLLRARRGATRQALGMPSGLILPPRGASPGTADGRCGDGEQPSPSQGTGHPRPSPSTLGRSAVAEGGRARGLWGHVKTPRQKFRAQVTSQINIVSLSDLTGR